MNALCLSTLLHLQYTNKDSRQFGESCQIQVSGLCHGFLKVSCISNKLDPHHLRELVQHLQNISKPMLEQFKMGATIQAWFTTKISKSILSLTICALVLIVPLPWSCELIRASASTPLTLICNCLISCTKFCDTGSGLSLILTKSSSKSAKFFLCSLAASETRL